MDVHFKSIVSYEDYVCWLSWILDTMTAGEAFDSFTQTYSNVLYSGIVPLKSVAKLRQFIDKRVKHA